MSTNTEATVETPEAKAAEFPCDECERSFPTPTGLKIHHMRTHGGRHWSRKSNGTSKTEAKPKVKAVEEKEVAAAVDSVTAEVSAPSCDVEFCPKCGFHVGEVSRAISVLTEISTAGGSLAYHADIKSGVHH